MITASRSPNPCMPPSLLSTYIDSRDRFLEGTDSGKTGGPLPVSGRPAARADQLSPATGRPLTGSGPPVFPESVPSRNRSLLSVYVDSRLGGMHGFGDLEAVIMHRVWDHGGPVTVRELFDELQQERVIAYTTVMTTMDNLHRKGWLARVKEGKAYRYTATASREEYSARLMREALDGGGDTQAVLSHFVAQMDGEESEVLRTVVRRLAERRPR